MPMEWAMFTLIFRQTRGNDSEAGFFAFFQRFFRESEYVLYRMQGVGWLDPLSWNTAKQGNPSKFIEKTKHMKQMCVFYWTCAFDSLFTCADIYAFAWNQMLDIFREKQQTYKLR